MRRGMLAALGIALAGAMPVWAESPCREDTLMLRGDWGQARFRVEVADSADERALGLMNRESMPSSAGMLFVFPETQPVGFWMKNTLIPLDMLFVDEGGTVARIHHKAIPLDPTPIASGGPVRYVLEINGGLAAAMGITEGSQIRHPAILQDGAVWSCEGGS